MKFKKYIYISILIFTTIIGLWVLPALVKKMTYTQDKYPFVYYSSILEELCLMDYEDKEFPMSDLSGNKYNTEQYDTLLPLLNYRQLMSDGKLPDSVAGHEITVQLLRSKSVIYRFSPRDIQTPSMNLHIMFESMPKRVGLKMPNDVFRLTNKIEFIDTKSNEIDETKSDNFQQALIKNGFTFPAQWSVGNPNPRKAYDEGYFVLDSEGKLFHVKMVNDRPFVRNTNVGQSIDIEYFSMLEVGDKRMYGFLYSKSGDVYILEEAQGKYNPLRLDIEPIDIKTDQLMVMGNLLYWTVAVTKPSGRDYYGLKTETLEGVAKHSIARELNRWDKISKWIFPYAITFEDKNSDYIKPQINCLGCVGFLLNLSLAAVVAIFVINKPKRRIFNSAYVFLTGLAGLLALLLLPNLRKHY